MVYSSGGVLGVGIVPNVNQTLVMDHLSGLVDLNPHTRFCASTIGGGTWVILLR